MSKKRKRLKKLLMGAYFSRDQAEWLIAAGLITDLSYAEIIERISRIFHVGKEAHE